MNVSEPFAIASIVEGQGEQKAVPKLLHKILSNHLTNVKTLDPIRTGRDIFFRRCKERKHYLNMALGQVRHHKAGGGVLILMDAEESCCRPLLDDPNIQSSITDIKAILYPVPYVFALAEKGYESWLVASLSCNPDSGQSDPARWLSDHPDTTHLTGKYRKTIDQAKLTSQFDIDRARGANLSFRRFVEKIQRMATPSRPGGLVIGTDA